MNTLVNELQHVKATAVTITEDSFAVDLADGRTLIIPLLWYPRLWHGTPPERQNWQLIGDGVGIHWPELDEDISVEGLLLGKKPQEGQRSLQRWLDKRASPPPHTT